ncbi:MAG: NAD(P)/FAD-dependent oxidoreductase [Thermodesulfobacteriota bacterium]
MGLPGRCDILVVGAGPAGSMAARTAASLGADTLLIDAKPRIGEQPHCAEFVPHRLFVDYTLPIQSVVQRVETMETVVLEGSTEGPNPTVVRRVESASQGFVIDRVRFDRELAREAVPAGARVECSARLVSRRDREWVIRFRGRDLVVQPEYVIAADGAASAVARSLGFAPGPFLKGLQAEVPLREPLDRTAVYLHRDFTHGYGWVFPKGHVANVGIGLSIHQGPKLPELLDRFLDWLFAAGIIGNGMLARWGGLIPVGGLRERVRVGNVLLAGDAAGLTHPISGAGISQAVVSGALAGRTAAMALQCPELNTAVNVALPSSLPSREGNRKPSPLAEEGRVRGSGLIPSTPQIPGSVTITENALSEYESEIKGRYRGVMAHARAKRLLMERLWDEPDFVAVCERTWIGFPGYRKREETHAGSRPEECRGSRRQGQISGS